MQITTHLPKGRDLRVSSCDGLSSRDTNNLRAFVFCNRDRFLRPFCSLRDPVCGLRDRFLRLQHKNDADYGIFFVLEPSSFLGAKKERGKRGGNSAEANEMKIMAAFLPLLLCKRTNRSICDIVV